MSRVFCDRALDRGRCDLDGGLAVLLARKVRMKRGPKRSYTRRRNPAAEPHRDDDATAGDLRDQCSSGLRRVGADRRAIRLARPPGETTRRGTSTAAPVARLSIRGLAFLVPVRSRRTLPGCFRASRCLWGSCDVPARAARDRHAGESAGEHHRVGVQHRRHRGSAQRVLSGQSPGRRDHAGPAGCRVLHSHRARAASPRDARPCVAIVASRASRFDVERSRDVRQGQGRSSDDGREEFGPRRSGWHKRDREHRCLDPHGRDDERGRLPSSPGGWKPSATVSSVSATEGDERTHAIIPQIQAAPKHDAEMDAEEHVAEDGTADARMGGNGAAEIPRKQDRPEHGCLRQRVEHVQNSKRFRGARRS